MDDVIQVQDQFYILATASRRRAHRRPEARRHVRRVRSALATSARSAPGEQGSITKGRATLSTLPPAAERPAAAPPQRAGQGRQRAVRRGSDESRSRRSGRPIVVLSARSRAPVSRALSVERHLARAASGCGTTGASASYHAHLRLRCRLRRHLRSARHPPRAARVRLEPVADRGRELRCSATAASTAKQRWTVVEWSESAAAIRRESGALRVRSAAADAGRDVDRDPLRARAWQPVAPLAFRSR